MARTIPIYDPRGFVETVPRSIAPRVPDLNGLRLGLLDNTKWNAGRLLRGVRERLAERHVFAAVTMYSKGGFSRMADPDLLDRIAAENDLVVTAIGD
jgi:hypothetical protein